MASRRSKGKNVTNRSGSCSVQPDYDTNRFPSHGAYEHFMHVIVTRNLIPECALSLEVYFFPYIIAEIRRRVWEALAEQLKDCHTPSRVTLYNLERGMRTAGITLLQHPLSTYTSLRLDMYNVSSQISILYYFNMPNFI